MDMKDKEDSDPKAGSEQGGGSHYWQPHRQSIISSPNLCMEDTAAVCAPSHQKPAWVPLVPALLPAGAKVLVLGAGRAHT